MSAPFHVNGAEDGKEREMGDIDYREEEKKDEPIQAESTKGEEIKENENGKDAETEKNEVSEKKSQDGDASGKDPSDKNENRYEDVCFICRRPESKAGKMYHLPNNICVCDDCMHRTMDAVSQYDYQGMLNNPELMNLSLIHI